MKKNRILYVVFLFTFLYHTINKVHSGIEFEHVQSTIQIIYEKLTSLLHAITNNHTIIYDGSAQRELTNILSNASFLPSKHIHRDMINEVIKEIDAVIDAIEGTMNEKKKMQIEEKNSLNDLKSTLSSFQP